MDSLAKNFFNGFSDHKTLASGTEVIVFNGVRYYRRANSNDKRARRYFRSNHPRQQREYLHRAVWRFYFGEIPKTHNIHHKDHNPLNNNPDNLECVSLKDHGMIHGVQNKETNILECYEHCQNEKWRTWYDKLPKKPKKARGKVGRPRKN